MLRATLPMWPADAESLEASGLPWSFIASPLSKNVQSLEDDMPGRCLSCGSYMLDRGDLRGSQCSVTSWRCPLCAKENEFSTVQKRYCFRESEQALDLGCSQDEIPTAAPCAFLLIVEHDLSVEAWEGLRASLSELSENSERMRFNTIVLEPDSWVALDLSHSKCATFRKATYLHGVDDVFGAEHLMPVIDNPSTEIPAVIDQAMLYAQSTSKGLNSSEIAFSSDISGWLCGLAEHAFKPVKALRVLLVSPSSSMIIPLFQYNQTCAQRLVSSGLLLDFCLITEEKSSATHANDSLSRLAMSSGGECVSVNALELEEEVLRLLGEEAMIAGMLRLRTSAGCSPVHRHGPGIRVHKQIDDICEVQIHGSDRPIIFDLEFTGFEGFSAHESAPAAQLAVRYWHWRFGQHSRERLRIQSVIRPSISRSSSGLRRSADPAALCSTLLHQILDGLDRKVAVEEIRKSLGEWLVSYVLKSKKLGNRNPSLDDVFKDNEDFCAVRDLVFRFNEGSLASELSTVFGMSKYRRLPVGLVMRSILPRYCIGPNLVDGPSPREVGELSLASLGIFDHVFEVVVLADNDTREDEATIRQYFESNKRPGRASIQRVASWPEFTQVIERHLLHSSSGTSFKCFKDEILRRALLAYSN